MATFSKVAKPSAHHDEKTWTGSASTLAITGLEFQPDWVLFFGRNYTGNNLVVDSVRGFNKWIYLDETDGEDTNTSVTATSDGISMDGNTLNCNSTSDGHIGMFWKLAGSTTTNDASATGVGTIDSSYRANTDAGLSVVTWEGTGANGTIAHGLGKIPDTIIFKDIEQDGYNWEMYTHGGNRASQTGGQIDETDTQQFFNTGVAQNDDNTYWNDTAPTSTVFSIGSKNNVNQSGMSQVAFCFANTNGCLRTGTYQGNGKTHGPFVFTGFKPRAVWIARYDTTGENTSWKTSTTMALGPDNAAQSGSGSNHGNAIEHNMKLDSTHNGASEVASQDKIQFFAQGFSPFTTDSKSNGSGNFYVYIAWADQPSVTTTKLLTTAF